MDLEGTQSYFDRAQEAFGDILPPRMTMNGLREHIRKTLQAAAGCELEITQRDVYTIHHNEEKAKRFIAIIREEIANHWKP